MSDDWVEIEMVKAEASSPFPILKIPDMPFIRDHKIAQS
jgi:hypothetical protein